MADRLDGGAWRAKPRRAAETKTAMAAAALAVAVAVAVAGPGPARPPDARADRAAGPSVAELTALADTVVVGRVTAATPLPVKEPRLSWEPSDRAEVAVTAVLKGASPGAAVSIGYTPDARHASFTIEIGRTLVFFLQPPMEGDALWGLVDHWDGAAAPSPAIVDEVRRVAARPGSTWRAGAAGVRALLVADRDTYRPTDEISLKLFVQNRGPRPVAYQVLSWPRAAHTYVALRVTAGPAIIAPVPVPWLTDAEIASYFAKRGKFSSPLYPGSLQAFRLDRINRAEKGWGYKEELDFASYPVAAPGEYAVSARAFHLVAEADVLDAGPVTIHVTP
ncbi:MAG TPA: hypothetical protein VG389_09000 [Myxococcota bacterium]|jgi:hypothetical protein|nr:hypothetical protein [Myxococcota bacterium]